MEAKFLRLAEEVLKSAETAAKVDGISVDKHPEVCQCVVLMKKLKDFPVSFDVLASTQVDKRLRHLGNHNKEKVRLAAKWLLEIWSLTIKDGISRKPKNGVISSVKTCRVEPTKWTNDQSFRNKRKRSSEDGIEKEERAFSCFKKPLREPKVSEQTATVSIESSDASRDKVLDILVEALRNVAREITDEDNEEMKKKLRASDPVGVAVSVESAMFRKLGPFNGAMKFKYRSILFNVKDPKNPDFRKKILLGEVNPERLVTMTSEEMTSHERQREINQIKDKALCKIRESAVEEESVGKSDYEAAWLESLW